MTEIMMVPTPMASTTIMAGSSMAISRSMAFSDSKSKVSAMLSSISSRRPDSSPMRVIEVSFWEKPLTGFSAEDRGAPLRICATTWPNWLVIKRLPMVSAATLRAWIMGRPLEYRVLKVRAKRAV